MKGRVLLGWEYREGVKRRRIRRILRIMEREKDILNGGREI